MTPTDHRDPLTHDHRDDEHLYHQEDLQNEDVAHEHSDVNIRAILGFAAGMVVLAAIIHVAMWGLFLVFENQATDNDPVVTPLAQPAGQLPPEPRLLTDEPQNLQRFRAELAERLKGIDEAKKQLLEGQSLPVRADAPGDAWMGTRSAASGEASGGRAIPVRPGQGAEQPPAVLVPGQPPAPAAPPKGGGH